MGGITNGLNFCLNNKLFCNKIVVKYVFVWLYGFVLVCFNVFYGIGWDLKFVKYFIIYCKIIFLFLDLVSDVWFMYVYLVY